jgi:hypothetical protein
MLKVEMKEMLMALRIYIENDEAGGAAGDTNVGLGEFLAPLREGFGVVCGFLVPAVQGRAFCAFLDWEKFHGFHPFHLANKGFSVWDGNSQSKTLVVKPKLVAATTNASACEERSFRRPFRTLLRNCLDSPASFAIRAKSPCSKRVFKVYLPPHNNFQDHI